MFTNLGIFKLCRPYAIWVRFQSLKQIDECKAIQDNYCTSSSPCTFTLER